MIFCGLEEEYGKRRERVEGKKGMRIRERTELPNNPTCACAKRYDHNT
jgi:hypothetical protein